MVTSWRRGIIRRELLGEWRPLHSSKNDEATKKDRIQVDPWCIIGTYWNILEHNLVLSLGHLRRSEIWLWKGIKLGPQQAHPGTAKIPRFSCSICFELNLDALITVCQVTAIACYSFDWPWVSCCSRYLTIHPEKGSWDSIRTGVVATQKQIKARSIIIF